MHKYALAQYALAMRVGIIGASGYAGGELLRYLLGHPHFELDYLTASSNAGQSIGSVHPHLRPLLDRRFENFDAKRASACELLFIALPHGESARIVKDISPECAVVDLGADFRIKDPMKWQKYYGGEHAGTWTYGLAEIQGQRDVIKKSRRIANPGCYATAIALGAAPLVASNVIEAGDITVVAASGTTGAGRTAKVNLLASEVAGSLSSYKFGGVHQHTPEIEESLSALSKNEVRISFTPILAPMPRGILATITAQSHATSTDQLQKIFQEYFSGEEFVEILTESMPSTNAVNGSNRCQMRVAFDSHTKRAVVSVAIDNLGKGAAGQAIQNANLVAGFDERESLTGFGVK